MSRCQQASPRGRRPPRLLARTASPPCAHGVVPPCDPQGAGPACSAALGPRGLGGGGTRAVCGPGSLAALRPRADTSCPPRAPRHALLATLCVTQPSRSLDTVRDEKSCVSSLGTLNFLSGPGVWRPRGEAGGRRAAPSSQDRPWVLSPAQPAAASCPAAPVCPSQEPRPRAPGAEPGETRCPDAGAGLSGHRSSSLRSHQVGGRP